MAIADRLPPRAKVWYQAARPRSLAATWSPLLIGAAVTLLDGVFNPLRFGLALFGALLLQAGANFVNEYIDFNRGADVHKTDGMGMALSRGSLTPQQVLLGAVVTILGGALIGLALMLTSGLTLLWIGLGGVLVVILYTAGPLPLAYIGLGELAVFIFMGPLMTLGTYYAIASGKESTTALLAGLPVAFTVANILHANNMRDYEADKAANKRTLAVRFGMAAARHEYAALNYGAFVTTALLVALRVFPIATLLVFAALPQAIQLTRQTYQARQPTEFHRIQGLTAQFHLRVGLWLTLGWLVSWFIPALR
jgi:1,4-dihydroxy-2-naphthoate octaprenyltransferase